ncbi:hypothetical protein DL762_009434 [Monosporascus cannonballus]|uniref:Uncharacterized protein n=1 Tax=Monosporascus cannonballus TaxID=155416 RepID=A0ABY0GY10_9PEZI|nr:hypothetical protein DL762_009434 [Monosporascus cannonballus]
MQNSFLDFIEAAGRGWREQWVVYGAPNGVRNRSSKKSFNLDYFDDAILSYPNQRDITLRGLHDTGEMTANLDGQAELPKKDSPDPWGLESRAKKIRGDTAVSSALWLERRVLASEVSRHHVTDEG